MTARPSIDEIDARVAGSTVPRRFLELAATDRSLPLFHSMQDGGGWHVSTAGDVEAAVARIAAGLQHDGVAAGDRVLLMMRNRPDFHWFDLAAQFLRATPVSIYNSSSPEEIQYLASHAGAEIAIVEDAGFLDRLLKVRDELPALEADLRDRPAGDGSPRRACARESSSMTHGTADLAALAAATDPNDIATLIYTSGTTGPPKGVMISQYNVVYTVEQLRECLAARRLRGHAGRVVPADGAHRRADDEPLPAADPRLQRVLLPRRRSALVVPEGGAPADRLRRATRLREDLQRRQRRARRRPGAQGAVRRRRRSRRSRSRQARARRHRHPGATRHVGVPRRRRVRQRARAGRARRGRHRDHRRGADPARRSSSGSTRSACRCRRSTA